MLKLTKNELRDQQQRLALFQRYLPTLQLKKAMLQFEVNQATLEVAGEKKQLEVAHQTTQAFSPLLVDKTGGDPLQYAQIVQINKRYENIAGAEVPLFDSLVFREADYFLFDTPIWMDQAVLLLREFVIAR